MPDNSGFNLAHVVSMIGNNPDDIKDLLTSFHENALQLLAQLEKAALFDDLDMWKKTAHRLRGAVANFGFEELQDLFNTAEHMPNAEKLEAHLPEIRHALQKALASIDETIKTL